MTSTITVPNINAERERERRRIRCVTIAGDILLSLLDAQQRRGSIIKVANGQLPDDARCVGMTHDPTSNTIRLYVHSSAFETTDEGEIPLPLHITYRSIHLPTKSDIAHESKLIDVRLDNKMGLTEAESLAARTEPSEDATGRAKQQLGGQLIDLLIECDVLAD